METQAFSDYLRHCMDKQQLTIKGTAERAGISRQNLHKILNGGISQARLTTFIQLAHALNEHPLHLFRAFFDRTDFPSMGTTLRTESFHQNDDIGFIGDITYPDNSFVKTGQTFEKIWEIQNVGKLIWEKRRLICLDEQLRVCSENNDCSIVHGLTPDCHSVAVPVLKPDERWKVSICFSAPSYPCTVISHWKMVDASGNVCFPENQPLTCLVKVVSL
jgi:transcriptional regulator with XRE-family HTH domain